MMTPLLPSFYMQICTLLFNTFLTLIIVGASMVNAQSRKVPKAEPSLPKYSNFESNIGIMEIVEVGVPVANGRAAVESSPLLDQEPVQPEDNAKGISISAGSRLYRTSNVLRNPVKTSAERSGVFEFNVGLSHSRPAFQIGEYISAIPRLDLMMQWAEYERYSAVLDNRFGMAKYSLAMGFPRDWSMGVSVEYNILHNLNSGDKTFDAIAPAWSLQKIFPVTDSSFLMADFMFKFLSSDQTMTMPTLGVYDDSGDNNQNSISATYIHMLDEDGKLMIMPRIGLTRTHYLKSPSKGRDDYLLSMGASFTYQLKDWLSLQSFITYSSMSSDEPAVDGFKALDSGFSLSASQSF